MGERRGGITPTGQDDHGWEYDSDDNSTNVCPVLIRVVVSTTMIETQNWPYVLMYLAEDVPPLYNTDG